MLSKRAHVLFLSCRSYLDSFAVSLGGNGHREAISLVKLRVTKKKKKLIYLTSNEMNFSSEIPDLETKSRIQDLSSLHVNVTAAECVDTFVVSNEAPRLLLHGGKRSV